MATILNIETSGSICSVAISKDGQIEYQLEDTEGMKHAERLAPFVDKCMAELARREWTLDAVAVSMGPGSYTGLRIGLSMAKGICFGLNIPLIGINTLKLLAVKAMFFNMDWEGDELLVPMIDARRMEVYTAAYDFALREVMAPRPLILNEETLPPEVAGRKVIFIGDGSVKAEDVTDCEQGVWLGGKVAHARDMLALSEKAFREGDFIDVSYSEPFYLKDYQAKKSVNKVLRNK